MLQLKYQLNGLKYELDGQKYQFGAMPPLTFDLSVSPQIDTDAIKKSLDNAQKALNKAGAKTKDQLKQFTSPDGVHTIVIAPEVTPDPPAPALVAPSAPEATPAPPTPPARLPQ